MSNEKQTSNKVQTTSNEVQVEQSLHSTSLKEKVQTSSSENMNKDFENMVDDAVKTIPEKELEQKEQQKTEEKSFTPEEAAGVALNGLNAVMGLAAKLTGVPLIVAKETQMVFAAMTTPLVMKYGKTIKGLLNPENVDLNSNIPEYLAIGALGVVAVPSYLQVKEHKKIQLKENLKKAVVKTAKPEMVVNNGDK